MSITNKWRWAFLISLLVVITTTIMLYLLIWNYGAVFSWKDARHYLGAGFNFYLGNGLFMKEYELETDAIILRPLTHFPPLVSLTYSGLMFLGVSPNHTPTIVALFTWPLFLIGIGLLTYRLSQSPGLMVFSIILAAITWPYLSMFTETVSEVVFLPLLVYLTLILVDLPQKEHRATLRLAMAAILLALLMLTRYVGIFLYLSVLVWWSWWRLKQQRIGRLVVDLIILFAAALPMLAWLARNELVAGHLFGPEHLEAGEHTFVDGLIAAVKQSSWIILPAVRPGPVWRTFGWVGLCLILILGIGGGYLLWRYRSKGSSWIAAPPRTPIPILLAVYFALYTILQPFFLFFPMTERFMTVALCLIQPWLLSMMVKIPRPWRYSYLSGFICLNLALMSLISVSVSGVPDWITFFPPQFHDLANRSEETQAYLESGMPSWLLHRPPRLNDLSLHHSEVEQFLQTFDSEVALVSNAPDLFTYHAIVPGDIPVSYWLDEGTCESHHDVLIIIFDWDKWANGAWPPWLEAPTPDQLQQEVEQKCPEVSKTRLGYSIIYQLPKQTNTGISEAK